MSETPSDTDKAAQVQPGSQLHDSFNDGAVTANSRETNVGVRTSRINRQPRCFVEKLKFTVPKTTKVCDGASTRPTICYEGVLLNRAYMKKVFINSVL